MHGRAPRLHACTGVGRALHRRAKARRIGVAGRGANQAEAQGASVRFVYNNALRGYSASLPEALLARLTNSANVDYVEPVGVGSFVATQNNPPSYGIDRVDQRNLPLNGLFHQDACGITPARVPRVLTVSGTTSSDAKMSYANYGTCVDLFAPGNSIVSAGIASNTASATMSGTSMASPHGAGAAALYLQANPGATVAQVTAALNSNATTGKVTSPGSGSPNRLLYTGFISAGGGGGNQAPVASFTNSCTNLTCTFTDTSTDSDGTIASRAWNFGDGTTSTATNPSKTYAAAGTYTVTLTVTDNGGATNTTSRSITVTSGGGGGDPDPSTPTLTNGVAMSGSGAAAGGWKYYKIQVPAGRPSLSATLDGPACGLLGCNPDLDLFVRRAAKPTTALRDCSGETGSSDETCSVSGPAGDWYYVGVYTYSGNANAAFTIRANY